MDSVQNDISVLFDASKVQASTHVKQTKTQVFESILNSLQANTKKSLSLDKSGVKNDPVSKSSIVTDSNKTKNHSIEPQDKKASSYSDSLQVKSDQKPENKFDENQPTSQSSKPSSHEPASSSEDGDTKQKENLKTNEPTNQESSTKISKTDHEINSEETQESETIDQEEVVVLQKQEPLAEDSIEIEQEVTIEVENLELAIVATEPDVSQDETITTDQESSDLNTEPEPLENSDQKTKNDISDFEIKALLQDVEALQNSPKLRELAQRVLETIEEYSDQDLATLGVENPERFKEIVSVLAAFIETPTKLDAKILDNQEVIATLDKIDQILQTASEISSGDIDISDLETVKSKVILDDSSDLKLFDEELLEDVEIKSVEVEEATDETTELRTTDEIKKDLKMIREDNNKTSTQKEEIIKEVVKDQEQKIVTVDQNENKDSELVKKAQTLVRTVGKIQSEQEMSSQETAKVDPSSLVEEASLSNEGSESESGTKEDGESLLALTKNFAKSQKSSKNDKTLSRFDQLLQKSNLVTEKVVSKEVGLSVDGSKKVMLTKVVRHPGFQSSTKIVVKQIQDLTKLLNPPKVNRLTMALKPERLGEVRLEIKQINDGVKLSFEVENHAVKEIIEKNLSQLKDSLKLQNIDASDVEVNVKDDRGESNSAKEEQESKKQKNKKSFDMNEELQGSEENSIDQDYQINQYA